MTKHDRDLTRSSQSSSTALGNPSDNFESYSTDLLEASLQAHELAVRAQKNVSMAELYASGSWENTNIAPSLLRESIPHAIHFWHTYRMMSTARGPARTVGRATGRPWCALRRATFSNLRLRSGFKRSALQSAKKRNPIWFK